MVPKVPISERLAAKLFDVVPGARFVHGDIRPSLPLLSLTWLPPSWISLSGARDPDGGLLYGSLAASFRRLFALVLPFCVVHVSARENLSH